MKKQIKTIVLGTAFMLTSSSAFSYVKEGTEINQNSNQVKGAGCSPATARLRMEFNDVSCIIEQGGSLWTDKNSSPVVASYEIPKGSGLTVIYAGALWMGGTDINGQLKLAALTYRQAEDFWPGPLTVTSGTGTYDPSQPVGDDVVRDFGAATIEADECVAYDKFYTVRKAEIIQFSSWWDCDQGILPPASCEDIVKPESEVMNRINNWPAHGDITKGQDNFLAPFYDNPNGPSGVDLTYNPEDGDYPWYDDILNRDDIECGFDRRISLFGDETHWWVFNDAGNVHGESNGDPIGMEIRAQAFSFATDDEVNRMTFYNYELINRGTQTLTNTFFSQYIDADIGGYNDDYAGCDVSRGLGYMYNGQALDVAVGAALGYGENPPSVGCDFFEGPYQDADGRDNIGPYIDTITGLLVTPTVPDAINDTGIVYQGIGLGYSDGLIDNERFGMRRFTYYNSSDPFPYTDPSNAPQFYNFMSGSWADGSEMVYGGTGAIGTQGSTLTPSDYLFPGDSDPLNWGTEGVDLGFDWSEIETDGGGSSNPPGDRRFVQSAGPFTLRPGAINNITVGIVYGRANSGGNLASIDVMKSADTKAQALFDACFRILEPPNAPSLTIQELENELVLMISNPVTSNNYLESYYEEDKINIVDPTVDRFYTFEGYQIYQMIDEDAGVSDISDDTKAVLVAQVDIKNDITDLDNFVYNEELGFAIGSRMVTAANKGIQHSFLMTEDAFAQGDKALVNHKRYYYIATAYAHNEYAPYDPNDPLQLDGQKTPYISSRIGFDGGSIQAVEAIPHNPSAESGGLVQNSVYGFSPKITRLDGIGNGGNIIDLTPSSRSTIARNGVMLNPEYQEGRGPVSLKVVDPLNVVDGYFECLFTDYTPSNSSNFNGADTASWVINRYTTKGGSLIESVSSDVTIEQNYEQLIPKWGISVQINQFYYYTPEGGNGAAEAQITDFLGASISYSDSSKRWLSGVTDTDNTYPTNWIRSGIFDPGSATACTPAQTEDWREACAYPDEIGYDPQKKWSKILGGIVAPHRLVGFQAGYAPLAYFDFSGTQARTKSSIKYSPSVDIVFTNDKSLWTRCPVVELGRETAFSIGGAQPGELRKSQSVDKNGNPDGTGTGMGWFPGYAVDVESGARLYMMFGENSFLTQDNGHDMIWNPTSRTRDALGNPIMGGMHPIYVFNYQKKAINKDITTTDYPAYMPSVAENNATNKLYQDMLLVEGGNSSQKTRTYGNISWVAYALTAPGFSINNGNVPTDAVMSLRVAKEYRTFYTEGNELGGPNLGKPMYSWNMDDASTKFNDVSALADVLDIINVVPNPYYAYSEYERNRIDTRVKITNLPEIATVKIFTSNGKLVRTFKKDSPMTSVDWDLNNHKGIPVAGGVYLIHVSIPDVGEVVLKFFGGMRQVDLQGI